MCYSFYWWHNGPMVEKKLSVLFLFLTNIFFKSHDRSKRGSLRDVWFDRSNYMVRRNAKNLLRAKILLPFGSQWWLLQLYFKLIVLTIARVKKIEREGFKIKTLWRLSWERSHYCEFGKLPGNIIYKLALFHMVLPSLPLF